ncbi:hypothetical protein ACMGE7_11720 [Macrococcus equi]|uniref:hypothetical protein n=1 Tax=Macrococcus equi TaxID=3395462 RepID=UPI0039BDAB94
MKLLLKFIAFTLLATVIITQATDHIVIQQYLMYFSMLVGFILAGHEVMKLEEQGGLK